MYRETLILFIQEKHKEYTGRTLIGLSNLSIERLISINDKLNQIIDHYSKFKDVRNRYTIDQWLKYTLSEEKPDDVKQALNNYIQANLIYSTLSYTF